MKRYLHVYIKVGQEEENFWWPQIQGLLTGTAKDSTDSVTTSAGWPILQIQNWHECCLLDAFLVIPETQRGGITITLSFTEGKNLLFHFYSPLVLHSNLYFKNNQNYKSISSSGFEPQSPFLSILHISITNCSESGRQAVWQADVPSAWPCL